uniref:Uncharacterized protein n=1 Tax=Salvator merianae TaxID=96440 RepID=A0A8D0BJL9_SALMN
MTKGKCGEGMCGGGSIILIVQFIASKWTLPHLPPRHPQQPVSPLCSCVLPMAKLILSKQRQGEKRGEPLRLLNELRESFPAFPFLSVVAARRFTLISCLVQLLPQNKHQIKTGGVDATLPIWKSSDLRKSNPLSVPGRNRSSPFLGNMVPMLLRQRRFLRSKPMALGQDKRLRVFSSAPKNFRSVFSICCLPAGWKSSRPAEVIIALKQLRGSSEGNLFGLGWALHVQKSPARQSAMDWEGEEEMACSHFKPVSVRAAH